MTRLCMRLTAGLLVCALGCMTPQPAAPRAQVDDTERDKDAVQTVGDLTTYANANDIPVSGVGLVIGLDGTGGGAPPGNYRTLLERELNQQRNAPSTKELFSSPDNALVLVSGVIPAGARKGDPIDLEVTLPPQSKTTSLRGGYLVACHLYDYDRASNLSAEFAAQGKGDPTILGGKRAQCEGPLLIGVGNRPLVEGDKDGPDPQKSARIWGGGKVMSPRPFYVLLNANHQNARTAARIAERINETFQGPKFGADKTAEAKNKEIIVLAVPPQYRRNMARFLRVVRMIPMERDAVGDGAYRQRLEDELLDPTQTLGAALRLEALGGDSIRPLKAALESGYPLVRFAAAESLAYLGQGCSATELAQLAKEQPPLQAYCLTALASMDGGAASTTRLRDLMNDPAPQVRYAAFRSLRELDETDVAISGERLNDSFWLHRVAPESPGLVHLLTGRRAEVVLFGQSPTLVAPFSILAGKDFTVTAGEGDGRCTVSRFSVKRGKKQVQCGFQVEEVLKALADLGATYPDAVELIRAADRGKSLSCPLAVDALPQAPSVQQLAAAGAEDPTLRAAAEKLMPKPEPGEGDEAQQVPAGWPGYRLSKRPLGF